LRLSVVRRSIFEQAEILVFFPLPLCLESPSPCLGGRFLGTSQSLALAFRLRFHGLALRLFFPRRQAVHRVPRVDALRLIFHFGTILRTPHHRRLEQALVVHELRN
jgi:hypothetical protein